ncbi:MAG TPA: alpha/beta hydrolase [Microlunatus sp.]
MWRHYQIELRRVAMVIRYDERGHGLSDRGVTDHSPEARVADLEAVADDAGLGSFTLLAMAQGGPVALEYAARHPERVTRSALYGSYATALGEAASEEEQELDNAFQALIRVGRERPPPEFRRVFTSLMIPGATESQMRWLDELQRMATDAETALLARSQRQLADSRHRLPELDLPTLVLHSRNDQMNGFGHSRYLAWPVLLRRRGPAARPLLTTRQPTSARRRGLPGCASAPTRRTRSNPYRRWHTNDSGRHHHDRHRDHHTIRSR